MTLPQRNRGRVRWLLARRLFPRGVEVMVSAQLNPGEPGVVRFGYPGRYNTVHRREDEDEDE